jgi:hypothetical protein
MPVVMANNETEQRDRVVECSLNSGEQNNKMEVVVYSAPSLEKYRVERTFMPLLRMSEVSRYLTPTAATEVGRPQSQN